MSIPRLMSNKHGRLILMSKQQAQFFDDNGFPDDETEADRAIEQGLCEEASDDDSEDC